MIERLIRSIVDQAKSKYKLRRIELRSEWKSKGYEVFFAHELCQCPLKRYYDKLYPELKEGVSFKPPVMIGEMIELAVKNYLNLEGVDTYKTIETEDEKYVIFGGIDMYDPKTRTVFDIKYTTSDPISREHHALRVKLYMWLLDTDRGSLIYISPKGFKEHIVKNPLTEEEVLRLIHSKKCPLFDWECKGYCSYTEFCSARSV